VTGANTNVTIADLKIAGGTMGNGIELGPAAGTPKLTLKRVTIGGGDGYGVFAVGGDLTMTQSTVKENRDGAISLSGTAFKLLNNIIHTNGAVDAPAAPVTIAGSVAGDVFELNTVTANTTTEGFATAVSCTGSASVRNNILWGNIDSNPGNMPVHYSGGCPLQTSIVGPMNAPAGVGVVDVDPLFGANFKLGANSPARNYAETPMPMTGFFAVDFDGESRPRPANEKADIGADEAP